MHVRLCGMAATIIALRKTEIIAYVHGRDIDWRAPIELMSGRSNFARERKLQVYFREVKKMLNAYWAVVMRFAEDAVDQKTGLGIADTLTPSNSYQNSISTRLVCQIAFSNAAAVRFEIVSVPQLIRMQARG